MMKLRIVGLVLISCLFSNIISAQQPEESRFTVRTLTMGLDEPMAITFLPDGKVLLVERKGKLKLYDPELEYISLVAEIPCNTKYVNTAGRVREAEEGLMGIVVDPNYEENNWIYIYYSDPDVDQHILTRWEFIDDVLIEDSRKVMLKIPAQRLECCHTGGGMTFDPSGNLYLTVGNNTSNGGAARGYAALDERPGREPWDDQRGSGNTNDLRGSVVRIKPLDDGTYAIPDGNLFPVGMAKTKPEIYAMGSRNPWRPTIDSKTGYLYWGEVGPDAAEFSEKGPAGFDEFNQAKKAGFYGWPYFAGDNQPYSDYDFVKEEKGDLFDVNNPINDSPNNTGLRELPIPTSAFIWYPYSLSEEFPLLGVSGRSATGVAVFHQNDFNKPERLWPDYYEGKLFISDFMRGWIMSVTMDENSDYESMERILPGENFSSLIDMGFSPSGDLYLLKYGSGWFSGSPNSALVRIEYNEGNRPPMAKITSDKVDGLLPLTVSLNSSETSDADEDELNYQWELKLKNKSVQVSNEKNPSFTIKKPGVYIVALTVSDPSGASSKASLEIKAGNSAPEITIDITGANQSFYFPEATVNYEVLVNDAEDGNLDMTEILPSEVSVNIDYMPESFDPIEISSNYATSDSRARFNSGYKLISQNDCGSCHLANETSIGPSYQAVADKYHLESGITDKLALKVIEGGEGVWGEHAMAAHPQLSESEAKSMVSYILEFAEPELQDISKGISGKFNTVIPNQETGYGGYVLRAAYTDQGSKKVTPIFKEEITFLSYPFLDPRKFDFSLETEFMDTPAKVLQLFGEEAYFGFELIDLSGISSVSVLIQASKMTGCAGGVIEIRQDSPDGPLVGKSEFVEVKNFSFGPRGESTAPPLNRKIDAEKIRRMAKGPAEYFLGQSRIIDIEIEPSNGKRDLYFVTVSPDAEWNQIVMSFGGIEFNQ